MSEHVTEIPRLSPSVAKHLLRAPSIAYQHHRLLGGVESEKTDAMRAGSILERFITGYGVDDIVIVDAADWRTKAAREMRDEVEAAGGIAVLAANYDAYKNAGDILNAKITGKIDGWQDYENQIRFEWQSSGVNCSGVLDQLRIEPKAYTIIDLKKTASAHPKDIQRDIVKYGYDVQYGAYVDAVETAYPHLAGRGKFLFVFYEAQPPYCVTVAQFDGSMRMLGNSKWTKAKRIWRTCMESGIWPDYVDGVVTIEAKVYDLEDLEETTEEELDRMFSGGELNDEF
jgi:hypothetical protein